MGPGNCVKALFLQGVAHLSRSQQLVCSSMHPAFCHTHLPTVCSWISYMQSSSGLALLTDHQVECSSDKAVSPPDWHLPRACENRFSQLMVGRGAMLGASLFSTLSQGPGRVVWALGPIQSAPWSKQADLLSSALRAD